MVVTRYDTPYEHLIGNGIFSQKNIEILLSYFEELKWSRHLEDFFDQYEVNLLSDNIPQEVSNILNTEFISNIKKILEDNFEVQLSERFTMSAHKFNIGQYINVHSDFVPALDYETHRVVIYVSESSDSFKGGQLIIFNSQDSRDINKTIEPTNNTLFAFEVSPKSYHGVETIKFGERYTINMSFWCNKVAYLEKIYSIPNAWKKTFNFLLSTDFYLDNHSSRNVIDHLVKTAQLLAKWGFNDSLQIAGLIHNIYGTQNFKSAKSKIIDRLTVKEIVGDHVELLIHYYCTTDKTQLYKSILNGTELYNVEHESISNVLQIDILVMEIANFFEQINYVETQFSEMLQIVDIFKKIKPFITERQFSLMSNTIQEAFLG